MKVRCIEKHRTSPGSRLVVLLELGSSGKDGKKRGEQAKSALRDDGESNKGNSGHSERGAAASLHGIDASVDFSNDRVHVQP